jgi:hypothetical protein
MFLCFISIQEFLKKFSKLGHHIAARLDKNKLSLDTYMFLLKVLILSVFLTSVLENGVVVIHDKKLTTR